MWVYDHLTFESGGGEGGEGRGLWMGDLRKKISWKLIWRESNMWEGNTWETNILHKEKLSLPTYNAGKKSYTIICRGKKISPNQISPNQITQIWPPPPPPQKSNVRPLRHVIGENRSHNCAHESEKALLASVSTKGIALETGLNNTVNKTLIHSWLDTISLRMPRSDETRLYSPAKIQ